MLGFAVSRWVTLARGTPVSVRVSAVVVNYGQRELLRAAIRTGLSLRGLSSHVPGGLRDAHESTLAWVTDALGPGATRTVHGWELRGEVPVYRDKAGSHELRADGTWALVQTRPTTSTTEQPPPASPRPRSRKAPR